VGLNSLKSLILTKLYPNNKNKNKVKSKPFELYELAGKNLITNPPKDQIVHVWELGIGIWDYSLIKK
jgi:hypothetical protein